MSNDRRTVLLLTQEFPPRRAPGCFRYVRFARFLPEAGWDCVVVTPDVDCHPGLDNSILKDISPGTRVRRFGCGDPAEHLKKWTLTRKDRIGRLTSVPAKLAGRLLDATSAPDTRMWSRRRICRAARAAIREHNVDAIWIGGPPFSYFLVGAALKREFGLPVVLDLRDPWTTMDTRYIGSWGFRRKLDRWLERRVFANSDRIIVNTLGACQQYRELYPDLPADRWAVLTNGYDLAEFDRVAPAKFDRTVFFHAGLTSRIRTSHHLIRAIARLRGEGAIRPGQFQFVSCGEPTPEEAAAIRDNDLCELVRFLGRVPHEQVLSMMLGADVLVLLVAEGHERNIPGKLYEYFAAAKPILMAGPTRSDAADLLGSTGAGMIAAIDDEKQLAGQIRQLLDSTTSLPPGAADAVRKYDIRRLAGDLAELLNQCTRNGRSA